MRSGVDSTATLTRAIGQPPDISPDHCVHSQIESGSCCACVSACPREALRLDDESLGLELDACDGCGLCVAACPTGAITQREQASDAEARRGDRLLLACEHGEVRAEQLQIPCVHALGPRQLLQAYREGTRELVIFTGQCDSCPRGSARRLTDSLYRVNQMLRSRGLAAMQLHRKGIEYWQSLVGLGDGADPGRRRFLRLPQARMVEQSDAPPALGAMLPQVSESEIVPWVPELDAERCDGCDACMRLCRQGALRPEELDGNEFYFIDPLRCVGCGICTDVCEQGAVRLRTWSARRRSALKLDSGRCRACGVFYHEPSSAQDSGGLCRICRKTDHYRNLHQVQY